MPSVTFEQELPNKVPAELRVYALVKPKVDRTTFIDVLSRFDLMAGYYGFEWEENGPWTVAERAEAAVAINKHSGALRFRLRRSVDRTTLPPFSIADPQVESLARSFLTMTGLVESAAQLPVRKITHLRVQTAASGQRSKETLLDAGIIFGRDVDGLPVSGPGGYVMVTVLGDESIASGVRVLRTRGPFLHTGKTIPPGEAREQLLRRINKRGIERAVVVERAELCYFERGPNDVQTVLEPAYAFIYSWTTAANQFPVKAVDVFPALRDSEQDWNPPKRFSRGE